SATGVLGPTVTVSANARRGVFLPDVGVDSNGNAVFIWKEEGSHLLVHARTLSAAGTLGPIQLDSGRGSKHTGPSAARIAVNGNGCSHLGDLWDHLRSPGAIRPGCLSFDKRERSSRIGADWPTLLRGPAACV